MDSCIIRLSARCLVLVLLLCNTINLGESHPARELHTKLLENYDKRVPPVARWDEPVEIILEYSPLHFKGLNERLQIFQMYCWLAMVWHDTNLTWSADEYEGLKNTTLYSTDIWTPDLGVINSGDELYGPIFDKDRYELMIDHEGSVRLVTAGNINTICILDVTLFPFDTQICHIEIDSWTLPFEKLHLSNRSMIYKDRLRANGAWDVTDCWVHIHKEELRNIMFHTLSFVFKLHRKPEYVIINTIIPVFLISLLELLVFCIPVEAGEKISLGVTLMLSLTVFQLVIQSTMPETSDFVPVVSLYITTVLIISALSLVFTVLVISLHYQNRARPVPAWARRCLLHCIANALGVQTHLSRRPPTGAGACNFYDDTDLPNDEAKRAIQRSNSVEYIAGKSPPEEARAAASESHGAAGDHSEDWMEVARVVDRLFFYVFLVVVVLSCVFSLYKCVGNPYQEVNRPLGGYGYKITND